MEISVFTWPKSISIYPLGSSYGIVVLLQQIVHDFQIEHFYILPFYICWYTIGSLFFTFSEQAL